MSFMSQNKEQTMPVQYNTRPTRFMNFKTGVILSRLDWANWATKSQAESWDLTPVPALLHCSAVYPLVLPGQRRLWEPAGPMKAHSVAGPGLCAPRNRGLQSAGPDSRSPFTFSLSPSVSSTRSLLLLFHPGGYSSALVCLGNVQRRAGSHGDKEAALRRGFLGSLRFHGRILTHGPNLRVTGVQRQARSLHHLQDRWPSGLCRALFEFNPGTETAHFPYYTNTILCGSY